GEARWRTNAGEEFSARLGEPLSADQTSRAWRVALDPHGDWMPAVLRSAHTRLRQIRNGGVPDAGGLVIATDQERAREYAALLTEITGRPPVLVLSDDPTASGRIGQFADSTDEWMVAVRMVSEGVDVPRLCVGVYATSASTPLYFAQAIGRFVRSRRPGETASVFLPSVPVLLQLASQMEAQRDHVLGKPHREEKLEDELLAQAERQQDEPDNADEEEEGNIARGARAHPGQSADERRAGARAAPPGGGAGAGRDGPAGRAWCRGPLAAGGRGGAPPRRAGLVGRGRCPGAARAPGHGRLRPGSRPGPGRCAPGGRGRG